VALAVVPLLLLVGLAEISLRVVGHRHQERFWRRVTSDHEASKAVITVLTLGESTTGGLWLPFESSYPKQLEQLLRSHYRTNRVSVVVPPHLGQNTSQMVHRLPRYLAAFRPQVVIIMAGVNNAWSLVESDIAGYFPFWSGRAWLFRARTVLDDVKVLRFLRLAWVDRDDADKRLDAYLEDAPRFTEWPPRRTILGGVDPNGEPFRRLWRHDVGMMVDTARQAGAFVVLMTYPSYDTPPVSEFEEMARLKGIPLVANHPAFARAIAEGEAQRLLFDDLHHPTAEGYAIVAENALHAMLETPEIARTLDAAVAGAEPDRE
jgi:lysophospholipase L1-like esterase